MTALFSEVYSNRQFPSRLANQRSLSVLRDASSNLSCPQSNAVLRLVLDNWPRR